MLWAQHRCHLVSVSFASLPSSYYAAYARHRGVVGEQKATVLTAAQRDNAAKEGAYGIEQGIQGTTQSLSTRKKRHRNQGSQQAVFDRRRSCFVS
jgi:hypothetical protein